MASHDDGYKLLFSHPEMVEDLLRGFVEEDWVGQVDFSTLEKVSGAEHAELHRAFTVWLYQVLLPARMPGVEVPKVASLQEVRSMLAEMDWTREWRQKGFEEGLEKGLEQGLEKACRDLQNTLLRRLSLRFGPVPESVRERLEAIHSTETLADLIADSAVATSLSALGLA